MYMQPCGRINFLGYQSKPMHKGLQNPLALQFVKEQTLTTKCRERKKYNSVMNQLKLGEHFKFFVWSCS